MTLPPLSFVHLDVDAYGATRDSPRSLLSNGVLLPKSLIVRDDYNRGSDRVNRAVEEVLSEVPILVLPVLPGEAVIVPPSYSR